MHKVVSVARALCVLVFFLGGCSTTEPLLSPELSSFATHLNPLVLPPFAESDTLSPAAKALSNSLRLDLGLQVLSLKTSFVEKKQAIEGLNGVLEDESSRRYLNFLATTASPRGGLVTEGEFSYSFLGLAKTQCDCGEQPTMLRLSLKDRWAGFNIGADYRSLGKGFVFISGERVDQARDEGQFWSEHSLGPFSLRGTVSQSWERLAEVSQFRLTKTAAAALSFNRPAWGGALASSFSLVGQHADTETDTAVFVHTIAGAYRPVLGLSLGSNFSFKQERNSSTGIKTETPAAAMTVVYMALKNRLALTGATSYTRSFSLGGATNIGALDLSAGINWKLGSFLARDDFLSFNVRYNHQLDFLSPGAAHEDFFGMLQLNIVGF